MPKRSSPDKRDYLADERAAWALPPKESRYKRFFGRDLYVTVTPATERHPRGSRSVGGRFWFRGKECRYTFGCLGEIVDGKTVTLAGAAELLPKIQADADAGLDPRLQKTATEEATGHRFANAFADWSDWRKSRVAEHRVKQVASMFDRRVLPYLGKKRLEVITQPDVVAVCRRIEDGDGENGPAPNVAIEAHGYIRAVFEYARSVGKFTAMNPCGDGVLEHLENPEPIHHAALQMKDLPQFFADLNAFNWYDPLTPLGIRLMMHVMTRTATLRHLEWDWIDWDARTIYVPPNAPGLKQKTKSKRTTAREAAAQKLGPYEIPMSKQVVAILREIETHRKNGCQYLFPHRFANAPCSSGTWYGGIKDMGWHGHLDEKHPNYRPNVTVHGMRATFLSAVTAHFVKDIRYFRGANRQLDHVDSDPVQAAYERDEKGGHRGRYLEQRREIMAWWSDQLSKAERAKVTKPSAHGKRATGFRQHKKQRVGAVKKKWTRPKTTSAHVQ